MGAELVLSVGTVRQASIVERVDAAVAGGFAGIGLRCEDLDRARAEGLHERDLRAVLGDRGVEVVELQVLWDWALATERSREQEVALYDLADRLGGRHLILNSELPEHIDLAVERFAAVCDRAAEHGLRAGIEFLPWTTIPDAGVAWHIVRSADRANGGVLVDTWHHYRGAADDALIRAIPGERVVAVHFDDAPGIATADPLHDTLHNRCVPGEGAFDLPRFVRLLDGMGVTAPYCVEILSDALLGQDPSAVARRVGDATRRVLSDARG